MTILFINQFFVPDGAATAQLLGDLVAMATCDVVIVCGESDYVIGESKVVKGITVHRVSIPAFGHSRIRRMWSYGGFYVGALVAALRGPAPDVVVTMTTPPLLSLIGLAVQHVKGTRHFIWEMDVYPDIATELGIFRQGGWVDRVVGWLADWPRRKADGVIALGPCMAVRLGRRGLNPQRIHVCHNWADGEGIQPRPFARDGKIRVLYSGNFGLAHDFDTVVGALELLGRDDGFSFLFSGGGPQWQPLRTICEEREYTSCRFQGFQPREALGELFGSCNVGLVTQKDGTEGTVVPSKTYGLMAAGRAIVYVGPAEATPARMLADHDAGWHIANGDIEGLVTCLRKLRDNPSLYEEAGHRARVAFEENYDLEIGVRRVLRVIGVPAKETTTTSEST